MVLPLETHHYIQYLLKRDVTKLYIAIAIRNFAFGMVLLFQPIYVYLYFEKSLPATLVFFALIYGLYGFLAPFAGRVMERLGTTKSILISLLFYFGFYLSLFLFPVSSWFVPLSVFLGAIAMLLFWPAFHTDFARFSSEKGRGGEVGKLNIMSLVPMVASPVIGGWILASFGYPMLFISVLVVLLSSSIPLFYCKETYEVYTDSYKQAWKRAFKKENYGTFVGFIMFGLEHVVYFLFWPLFMFFLAISFALMGGITSFALVLSAFFMFYIGKVSDTEERPWLLNVGALWTGISWVIKFFVTTPFDAFLAHALYRVSLSAANIPFQTFFYEKVAQKGQEADEFVITREIIINVSTCAFLLLVAGIFFFFPALPINAMFFVAGFFALGFMFIGKIPKLSLK